MKKVKSFALVVGGFMLPIAISACASLTDDPGYVICDTSADCGNTPVEVVED